MKPKTKKNATVRSAFRQYMRETTKAVETPKSTGSTPTPTPTPDRSQTILRACARLTRETIQTVKPSLSDAQAFALYVLCEHAIHTLTASALEHLQKDFHVAVSSDEQIHSL